MPIRWFYNTLEACETTLLLLMSVLGRFRTCFAGQQMSLLPNFFWRYSVTLDLPNRGRKNLVTQYSTTMQKVGQLCTAIALGKGQKRVTKVRAE